MGPDPAALVSQTRLDATTIRSALFRPFPPACLPACLPACPLVCKRAGERAGGQGRDVLLLNTGPASLLLTLLFTLLP